MCALPDDAFLDALHVAPALRCCLPDLHPQRFSDSVLPDRGIQAHQIQLDTLMVNESEKCRPGPTQELDGINPQGYVVPRLNPSTTASLAKSTETGNVDQASYGPFCVKAASCGNALPETGLFGALLQKE